jgi:hypothetical protein
MGWAVHVVRKKRKTKILVNKPEGVNPFLRSKRRSKHIKIYRKEIGWKGVDWINLVQDNGQVAGYCKHVCESSGYIKCRQILGISY